MEHGNKTENTSLVDLLLSVKRNVFKTLNTLDVYVVKQINDDLYVCQSIVNQDMSIECVSLQGIDVAQNDAVLVAFTGSDFRASLAQFKNNPNGVWSSKDTQEFHDLAYGVIIGRIWPKR